MEIIPFPVVEQRAQGAQNIRSRTEEGHNFNSIWLPYDQRAQLFQRRSLLVLTVSMHDLGTGQQTSLLVRCQCLPQLGLALCVPHYPALYKLHRPAGRPESGLSLSAGRVRL